MYLINISAWREKGTLEMPVLAFKKIKYVIVYYGIAEKNSVKWM